MATDWQELTNLTRGEPIQIERVRMTETDIAIEGSFELPPLARLTAEDQVFVAAFVRSHGSIKRMEQLFGVSYPTVKNRPRHLMVKVRRWGFPHSPMHPAFTPSRMHVDQTYVFYAGKDS